MVEVIYEGSYIPLRGSTMSEAYASALELSFEVRGGLLMRQVHHWAALLFLSAMAVHMLRVFFTGAFRRPREINWMIGVLLFLLGFVNGFTGYSVVDDLLSGTGLRIAQGIMLSIPVVGSYVSFLVFGGEYPGDDIVARLYTVHILLVPGIILALVTAHILLVYYQKHTQYPGAGRTDKNVVGYPFFPVYTAKAGGFFFVVFGVTTLLAGLVQINPIWLYGPYDPAIVSAGTQPDWYVGWLDGALRIFPGVETRVFGITLPWNIIVPGPDHDGRVLHACRALPVPRGSGSPATSASTTCSTARATRRPGRRSAPRSWRSTACSGWRQPTTSSRTGSRSPAPS